MSTTKDQSSHPVFLRPCSVPIMRHINTFSHNSNFVVALELICRRRRFACLENKFISSSAESLTAPTQIVDHTNHLVQCTNFEIVESFSKDTHHKLTERSHMRAGGSGCSRVHYTSAGHLQFRPQAAPRSSEHQAIIYFVACI